MSDDLFYGPDQAAIHHSDFGTLPRIAADSLLWYLREAGLTSGTVVDLGSGSGILARILTDAGYDVRGVDISPAMVELARTHAPGATFVVGALLDAEIPSCVAVTATGEALNYAADPRAGLDAVRALATRVRPALAPGGVFLFDVSTPGREGPDRTRHQWHDRERWTLYMSTKEEDRTLDRLITVFTRRDDGCYRRSDEHHVLRLYEPEEIVEVLTETGFTGVEVLEDYPIADPHVTLMGWRVFVGRTDQSIRSHT